jgi:DNA modification methylase
MQTRLDEDSVDCVITDPPYGVDVDVSGGMNRTKDAEHKGSVDNDGYEEALDTFRDTLAEIGRVLNDDGLLYVFASWKTYPEFANMIKSHGYNIFNCLVWVKSDTTPFTAYQGKYQYQHEFCIFAGTDNARDLNKTPSDVMEYDEARFSDVDDQVTTHPTQKPFQLISDLIKQSSDKGDTILDPFMGSGTTAVAAIQNDRDYVGFELDEDNYQSVIERRIGEAKRQVAANED